MADPADEGVLLRADGLAAGAQGAQTRVGLARKAERRGSVREGEGARRARREQRQRAEDGRLLAVAGQATLRCLIAAHIKYVKVRFWQIDVVGAYMTDRTLGRGRFGVNVGNVQKSAIRHQCR